MGKTARNNLPEDLVFETSIHWFYAVRSAFIERIGTSYCVTQTRLEIRRGIIGRRTRSMRLAQIRAVDIRQPLLGLLLGYGHLEIVDPEGRLMTLTGIAQAKHLFEIISLGQR